MFILGVYYHKKQDTHHSASAFTNARKMRSVSMQPIRKQERHCLTAGQN